MFLRKSPFITILFAFLISASAFAQGNSDRIIFHYLKLSAALSKSDLKQSKLQAEKLVKQSLESPFKGLHASSELLKKSGNLEQIRQAFSPFSDTLAVLISTGKIAPAESLFLVHCPMAFQDRGADWISDKPKVINPYFGDEMLHCGKVKSTIFNAEK
jgi:hypothetical protein